MTLKYRYNLLLIVCRICRLYLYVMYSCHMFLSHILCLCCRTADRTPYKVALKNKHMEILALFDEVIMRNHQHPQHPAASGASSQQHRVQQSVVASAAASGGVRQRMGPAAGGGARVSASVEPKMQSQPTQLVSPSSSGSGHQPVGLGAMQVQQQQQQAQRPGASGSANALDLPLLQQPANPTLTSSLIRYSSAGGHETPYGQVGVFAPTLFDQFERFNDANAFGSASGPSADASAPPPPLAAAGLTRNGSGIAMSAQYPLASSTGLTSAAGVRYSVAVAAHEVSAAAAATGPNVGSLEQRQFPSSTTSVSSNSTNSITRRSNSNQTGSNSANCTTSAQATGAAGVPVEQSWQQQLQLPAGIAAEQSEELAAVFAQLGRFNLGPMAHQQSALPLSTPTAGSSSSGAQNPNPALAIYRPQSQLQPQPQPQQASARKSKEKRKSEGKVNKKDADGRKSKTSVELLINDPAGAQQRPGSSQQALQQMHSVPLAAAAGAGAGKGRCVALAPTGAAALMPLGNSSNNSVQRMYSEPAGQLLGEQASGEPSVADALSVASGGLRERSAPPDHTVAPQQVLSAPAAAAQPSREQQSKRKSYMSKAFYLVNLLRPHKRNKSQQQQQSQSQYQQAGASATRDANMEFEQIGGAQPAATAFAAAPLVGGAVMSTSFADVSAAYNSVLSANQQQQQLQQQQQQQQQFLQQQQSSAAQQAANAAAQNASAFIKFRRKNLTEQQQRQTGLASRRSQTEALVSDVQQPALTAAQYPAFTASMSNEQQPLASQQVLFMHPAYGYPVSMPLTANTLIPPGGTIYSGVSGGGVDAQSSVQFAVDHPFALQAQAENAANAAQFQQQQYQLQQQQQLSYYGGQTAAPAASGIAGVALPLPPQSGVLNAFQLQFNSFAGGVDEAPVAPMLAVGNALSASQFGPGAAAVVGSTASAQRMSGAGAQSSQMAGRVPLVSSASQQPQQQQLLQHMQPGALQVPQTAAQTASGRPLSLVWHGGAAASVFHAQQLLQPDAHLMLGAAVQPSAPHQQQAFAGPNGDAAHAFARAHYANPPEIPLGAQVSAHKSSAPASRGQRVSHGSSKRETPL